MEYVDPVQRVLEILKGTFANGPFKEFYEGDPGLIPNINLPAVVVQELGNDSTPETSFQDDVVMRIMIKVVFNKKDDWKADLDPQNGTEHKIRQLLGLIDPATNEYSPDSVKGAIRRQLSRGALILEPDMNIEIGVQPRLSDLLTQEGHLTITVRFSVNVREQSLIE